MHLSMENKKVQQLEYIISGLLSEIGDQRVMAWLLDSFENEVDSLQMEIEVETDYAKNETESYRLQKKEAWKTVKAYKKVEKDYKTIIGMMKKIINIKQSIDKVY